MIKINSFKSTTFGMIFRITAGMQYRITKPEHGTRGTIILPASKSISNRLLVINALLGNRCRISNLSESDDTAVLLHALQDSGMIKDIGLAGTAMRFLTAYLSITPGTWILTGAPRMKERPVGKLADTLVGLGAKIRYLEQPGYPPLEIKGKRLAGGTCRIDSSVSSQFVSALLMIAPCLEKGLIIELENKIVSAAYIRMTLGLMNRLGIAYEWKANVIRIAHQEYVPGTIQVEADWSAASYWYAVVCFAAGAEVRLAGLHRDSLQGDSVLPRLFDAFGVGTEFTTEGIRLFRSGSITGSFEFDFQNNPDLVQTVVVVCGLLGIPFRMEGLETLRIKETDRVAALVAEMGKLGIRIHADPSGVAIEWDGKERVTTTPGVINTYNDHRMAMAFAPAAWHLGEVCIDDPAVVNKSYPDFWKDLSSLGCSIS
jgi:3-phosphoshikimate 1-carboxyvinyltransferase